MNSLLKSLTGSVKVYASQSMLVLLCLGFSSGLPLILIGSPLQAWLTEAGATTAKIGEIASILTIPYTFKFVWSPLLDRYILPIGGRLAGSRRRGWMLLIQILLIAGIALLGVQSPTAATELMVVAFGIAFLSASQDIAVDAYRTDVLAEKEMGAGAAIFVNGYRIAVLTAGGLALYLADRLPWSVVYGLMAGLMGVGVVTSYFAPEPPSQDPPPASLQSAVIDPFRAFLRRYPLAQGLLVLLFIALYQLADRLSGPMTTTFLLQTGFSKTDLGLRFPVTMTSTIIGGLAGGSVVNQLGIRRSLLLGSILLGASNLSFMGLALVGLNYPAMYAATVVENFCAGVGTSAFLAFLMSLCDRQFSATQYALFSSLFAASGIPAGLVSGILASVVSWPMFWGLTSFAALPGLALLLGLPKLARPVDKEDIPDPSMPATLNE